MKILNQTKNTTIAHHATIANTFTSRMTGLLRKTSLAKGEALVITHCQSIHMFFMKFAIDVIFVDTANKVVGLVKNIQPFRLSPVFFRSSYALETPVGVIEESQTALGDQIILQ